MASSRNPLGSALDHHFFKIPARSPGPLGLNDHADPTVTSLLGDTPGPLGINDHATPILSRSVPARTIASPFVAVDGTPMSRGIHHTLSLNSAVRETGAATVTSDLLKAAESGNNDEYYMGLVACLNEYASEYL